VATPEDIKDYESNKNRASTFLPLIRNLISKHNLEMKIVDIAFTLDTTKIMIIYASEERVDFRELLRDLAVLLKCRIDLKQIAPRDRAKIIGGVGICGLILCCSRILSEFDSINMKYIRNQNLAYDIAKLSGPCGKLICCLKFEDEYYTEFRESLPKINDIIRYNGRNVKVVGYNVLKRQVKLSSFNGESEEIIFVPASELDGSNKQ
jgi:cell fate regulator YaaT (PSP1 superfamily)